MTAWLTSDVSNSGWGATLVGERLPKQFGQARSIDERPGEPTFDAPAIPEHGQGGGGDLVIGCLGVISSTQRRTFPSGVWAFPIWCST